MGISTADLLAASEELLEGAGTTVTLNSITDSINEQQTQQSLKGSSAIGVGAGDFNLPTKTSGTSSDTIIELLEQRISTAYVQEDIHLEKIIVLDDAKNVYVDAINRIDKLLFDSIEEVNDSIQSVNDAYQDRINAGCYTDLFWRLNQVEISESSTTQGKNLVTQTNNSYTYECVRLSPSGYPSIALPETSTSSPTIPNGKNFNTGPSIGSSYIDVGSTVVEYVVSPNGDTEIVPLDSTFGLEPVNLYALKMYDEPYTHDIGDTYITSFIGTCGIGTNKVIAMTPLISGGIDNVKTGQLLICDKANVLNTDAYVITGIGTATANLSGINTTQNPEFTSNVVVPTLILDDVTLQPCYAPEDDGSYVTFTVLQDPSKFGDLSLSREDSPYVNQTIRPMTRSDIGKAIGVMLEFDKSGNPSAPQRWNQFLEGSVNPDVKIKGDNEKEIRQKLEENIVEEPKVGGGKVYHRTAFKYAPVIYTNTEQTKYRFAKEGEIVVLSSPMGIPNQSYLGWILPDSQTAGVERLPDCSSEIESHLKEAIELSDRLRNNLSSSTIQNRLEVTNMLRKDMSDLNIRIWTERQLLGDAKERQGTYSDRKVIVNDYREIINGV